MASEAMSLPAKVGLVLGASAGVLAVWVLSQPFGGWASLVIDGGLRPYGFLWNAALIVAYVVTFHTGGRTGEALASGIAGLFRR